MKRDGIQLVITNSPFSEAESQFHQVPIPSGEDPPTVEALLRRYWHPLWRDDEILILRLNGEGFNYPQEKGYRLRHGDHLLVGPEYGWEVVLAIAIYILKAIVAAVIAYALGQVMNKLFGPDQPSMRVGEGAGRPTYGWNGPSTIYQQGSPVPVIYGNSQTGGQVISYFVENDGKRSYINLLLHLGDGPVKSVGGVTRDLNEVNGVSIPPRIWVEGTPLQERRGVKVWTRLGNLNQKEIPGFNDRVLQYPVNREVRPGADKAVLYTTHLEVDRAKIRILFDEGLWLTAGSKGTIYSNVVFFRVRWRSVTSGSVKGVWTTWKEFGIRETNQSPFTRDHDVEFASRGQWELELQRTNARTAAFTSSDKATWNATLEVQDQALQYPRGVLVAVRALATEGLNTSQPQFRIEYEGQLVRVWNGSAYVTQYSANPWWVVLDMLQNTHYGLGDQLRHVTYPLADFVSAANEADTLVHAGLETTVNQTSNSGQPVVFLADTTGFEIGDRMYLNKDGATEELITILSVHQDSVVATTVLTYSHTNGQTAAKYHEKYRFDGQFDEEMNAWEAIQLVARAARGSVMKLGNRIIISWAVARDPMILLNEGTCRNVRLTYLSHRTQANEWRAQFLRRVDGISWDMDTMVVQDENANLDSASATSFYSRESRRVDDMRFIGVVRHEQVRRDLNFRKRVTRNSGKLLTLEAPLEAMGTFPGRVFGFAHHTLGLTYNGRILAGVASGSSSITLDREVVLAASTTYVIHIRTDDDELVERTVSSAAGTYARGDAISIIGTWPEAAQRHAPYALGVQGEAIREYEITNWRMSAEFWVSIEAVEYNALNYVESDGA